MAIGGEFLTRCEILFDIICKAVGKSAPTACKADGDAAQDDNAEGEQDALGTVNIGYGAKTAGCDVDHNNGREGEHTYFNADHAVGEYVEEVARGAELYAEIRY